MNAAPTACTARAPMRTPALPIATNEGTSGRLWRSYDGAGLSESLGFDFAGTPAQVVGGLDDVADQLAQLRLHVGNRGQQAVMIVGPQADRRRQVAGGDLPHHRHRVGRFATEAAQQVTHDDDADHQQDGDQHADHRQLEQIGRAHV